MQILEITQKQFLSKLSGDPHTKVLSVIKELRNKHFPKSSGVELKLQSKTKYLPQNASYKLYVHFMPIDVMLQYNAKSNPQNIINARAAQVASSMPKLRDLLNAEFPKGGRYDSFANVDSLKPGESYVIKIWVHSPRQ